MTFARHELHQLSRISETSVKLLNHFVWIREISVCAGIPFLSEKNEIIYKGVTLPHYYYADFVVWDKILFEAKAVDKLTDSHINKY